MTGAKCPRFLAMIYLKICELLKVNVLSGFLFCMVSKEGLITSKALEPSASQARLALYVKSTEACLYNSSFTLHGFRSGAAVSLALVDVSLERIMDHVGWNSSKTAPHYIKLKEVVNP